MATSDSPTDAPSVRDGVYELTARLSTTEEGTTVCTIYPVETDPGTQTTRWLSAEDDSFVDAENYR